MTSKTTWGKRLAGLLILVAFVACALLLARNLSAGPGRPQSDDIVLVVPDNVGKDNRVYVQAWEDAALEEGVRLRTMSASEFVRHGLNGERTFAGVILPDTVHRSMTTALINQISQFVQNGGALMQVYDAGILNEKGFYEDGASRMSTLAGVQYGFYSALRAKMEAQATVYGDPDVMADLHIPPGRWIVADGRAVLSGYGRDMLQYPTLQTRGDYAGTVLLRSEDNSVIAGERAVGKGAVLFVNLPLTYLKLRTDGVLMHGFLSYFAGHMLEQPRLSPAPQGVGGLVLNWHCDARICIDATDKLIKDGVFKRGPFSFHITAGPDQRQFGDGLGVDLANNPEFADVVHGLMQQGHEVGSHGGWIHDWFGLTVNEDNQASMETYLQKNADAIQALTGKPQTEYSAPTGNQPEWATRWLDEHNVKGYYFTGNIGQGPTRTYRNGRRDEHIWSFPVQTYGQYSTIEEAYMSSIPEPEIAAWLTSLVKFTTDTGEVRLIYFHPPGAVRYLHAIDALMDAADAQEARKRFRWHTITQMAEFAERREKTVWQVTSARGDLRLNAENPQTLNELTWLFPVDRYDEPRVEDGQASVNREGDNWRVVAGAGNKLAVAARLKTGS
ncbi:polysaccharide deacetylase family protein [Ralstonia soli]|uniref:Polysaccharide deacetylase family protein n=1 Tax=Ralstonia soli TaxID=2953896 RepID=A0ABT1AMH2_9RALS|nr:polysaccharide deacetylase family protein [Ralstonia soli]MCO5399621.1 polysaccharide deacetylase family protein [Ralstonia soli]